MNRRAALELGPRGRYAAATAAEPPRAGGSHCTRVETGAARIRLKAAG